MEGGIHKSEVMSRCTALDRLIVKNSTAQQSRAPHSCFWLPAFVPGIPSTHLKCYKEGISGAGETAQQLRACTALKRTNFNPSTHAGHL